MTLDGLIAPPNETFSRENIEIIYGEAYGNKTVTLIDCSAMLVQFASGGLSTSSYFANQMFIGSFHLKNTEPNFKASSTAFFNLTNWIRAEWFYRDKITDEIKIRDVIKIELMKTDEIELKLVEVHSKTFSFSDIHIFNNTILNLSHVKQEPIKIFQKYIYGFQNLCTLLAQNLIIEDRTSYFLDDNKFPEYKLYLPQILDENGRRWKNNGFIQYRDIKDNLTLLYEKWMTIEITQEQIIGLFFTTIFNKSLDFTYRFLHLTQTLEVYYSSYFPNKYLDDKTFLDGYYPSFVEKIPNELNNDFKQSIKQKFKYLHYHSFRKALKEIVNKVKGKFPIINFENIFIEDVVNTRNYLVHRSDDLRDLAKHEVELSELTDKLYFLLTFCFYIDIGVDDEIINKSIMGYKEFKEYFPEM